MNDTDMRRRRPDIENKGNIFDNLELVRTTAEFNQDTVPPGLTSTHRVADGVWGRLVVRSGSLVFRFEDGPGDEHPVAVGEVFPIPPNRPHHLDIAESVTFVIEFYRPRSGTSEA